jgi:hypothetical protein
MNRPGEGRVRKLSPPHIGRSHKVLIGGTLCGGSSGGSSPLPSGRRSLRHSLPLWLVRGAVGPRLRLVAGSLAAGQKALADGAQGLPSILEAPTLGLPSECVSESSGMPISKF